MGLVLLHHSLMHDMYNCRGQVFVLICLKKKIIPDVFRIVSMSKVPSINDVTQIFGVFGPPPRFCHATYQYCL